MPKALSTLRSILSLKIFISLLSSSFTLLKPSLVSSSTFDTLRTISSDLIPILASSSDILPPAPNKMASSQVFFNRFIDVLHFPNRSIIAVISLGTNVLSLIAVAI